ncbi:histidine kinase dimerization/phospho-acceptor domain-containing protein [Erythrobacter sp. NE805]|uniref:histidine kinase dimerization/phospho-acceptor domain-containing protein n=1 Tax=Erythrobacter sp. NE805 TaxID=3389875 RepID=UPI00396B36DB
MRVIIRSPQPRRFARALRAKGDFPLFFDDRLATVLRQRATGEANLRTQFRQLLDLLGRDRAQGTGSDASLIAAAWLRMEALADAIPAATRARLIREPGWRFRNPDLAAHFADHEPEVAAAALARADLAVEDWNALIPRLPVRARGFLRLRRDLPLDVEALLTRLGVHDRGLPPPAEAPRSEAPRSEPAAPPPADPPAPIPLRRVPAPAASAPVPPRSADETGRTEISALVERIAQFRRERGESPADLERSPRLPLGEVAERPARALSGFGFAADTAGRIAWAAAEVAPMVIGTRLFVASAAGSDDPLARAFARRQPIARGAVRLEGAPAISGEWIVDAEPRFSEEGHFAGYVGRFRRPADAAVGAAGGAAREADRIRQLLHELRTPVTAVQGYAEVIQQQLFGPAPHEYRALAAAIAADAARILAGFEELDRLARLETGALAIAPGESDLAALVRRTAVQLDAVLGGQQAGLALALGEAPSLIVAIDAEDAEALVWRLLASLAAACAPGERIAVALDPLIGGSGRAVVRLRAALPARLAAEENLFAATIRPAQGTINAGLFGTGFALRLARAEARAAGGDLRRSDRALELTLPLLGDSPVLPGALGG